MKTSVKLESEWIQTQAFTLIEGILSEPVYVIGVKMMDNDRLEKMLHSLSPLHAMIIQAVQLGHMKRAARYLILLRKISHQLEDNKIYLKTMITDRIMGDVH